MLWDRFHKIEPVTQLMDDISDLSRNSCPHIRRYSRGISHSRRIISFLYGKLMILERICTVCKDYA